MRGFWYVYVLISRRDGRLYVGSTSDLERRITDHSTGKNISTVSRRPLALVYFEGHLNKSDALRRERYFKTAKGKVTLKQMIRDSYRELPEGFW
ncbi:MAG: GIY-YIG nuclease family protein [Bacillati bacterium ANGP1]|uniref:GIY-YIG nuclease family protein n=1 Tax=Candidatus Segetimicrobium genomatis TaxID=2569760 RepID=A0A537L003_9BACT|nr:MAG: GIY-YIG nuclease family protein [Terrabacteria group bacterium ANGP1]